MTSINGIEVQCVRTFTKNLYTIRSYYRLFSTHCILEYIPTSYAKWLYYYYLFECSVNNYLNATVRVYLYEHWKFICTLFRNKYRNLKYNVCRLENAQKFNIITVSILTSSLFFLSTYLSSSLSITPMYIIHTLSHTLYVYLEFMLRV